MKKLAILFTLIILCFASNAYAKEVANIPSCAVTLSGQSVDNSYRQYPLLQYRDIVYFPMTYYDCRFLGVATKWNADTSTLEIAKENISGAYRDYVWEQRNKKLNEISICNFNIIVNGKVIDNEKEEYPLITFRNVTYFPLTWRFAVDELGWEYNYDDKNGLVITADNYICKPLNLPDLRTQINPDVSTDGTYYYYTGNDKKIYRTPVDNPSDNELIYTTAHNHYFEGGNNDIDFSVENGNIYLSYRTGASMGTNYRLKINPDGTTEDSREGSFHESFLGGSETRYDCDGFIVRVYRGGKGNSRVLCQFDGSEEFVEILSDGIVFAEINIPDKNLYYYSSVYILGKNLYLTGYNKDADENSHLYCYNIETGNLALLEKDITSFIAFTGWDNETNCNSDMIVYDKGSRIYRYSGASGKTIVIKENSLPFVTGVCCEGTLYLYTENEEKSAVDCYPNYGIGSNAGTTIFETTLPTDVYIRDGMLITSSVGDTDGDKDIRTCVFNNPSHFFRSSDSIFSDFFLYDGKLIFIPVDMTTPVEVDLNKTFSS